MMRGGTPLLCFVSAALLAYCCAQDFLPCGDDNLACVRTNGSIPITDVCYTRSQLCDDVFLCELQDDEGNRGPLVNALDCTGAFGDPKMFRCAGGMGFVTIDHLCDGNGDCPNGNDETIALCANKCRLPFYGGCSRTRECVSAEATVNCGACLAGYVEVGAVDCLPIITFGLEASTYDTSENETSVEVCASLLSGNITGSSILIQFDASPGSAMGGGADYSFSPVNLTFSSGMTRQCVDITIIDDGLVEQPESFLVQLTAFEPNVFLDPQEAIVTIADNDVAVFQFTQLTYSATESDRFICEAIELVSGQLTSPISLTVVTQQMVSPTAATAAIDYNPNPLSGTLIFLDGSGPGTILRDNITIVDENLVEVDEEFLLSVSLANSGDPAGFVAGRDTAITLILNDDDAEFGIGSPMYMADEGTTLIVPIDLVNGELDGVSLTVEVSCSSDTATINDDFQCSPNPFQLTFPDGSSSASRSSMSITITILSDNIIEDTEDFQLSLTAVSSAAAVASGQGSSTVTITDQKVLAFRFQFPSYSIPETNETLVVNIVLVSGSLDRSVTLAVETSDDDAVAPSDYIAGPVSVTFGVGDSQASASITIINDNAVEQLMESFGLSLSSSDNAAVVSGATSQATIIDNDLAEFGIGSPMYMADEGTTLTVPIDLVNGELDGVSLTVEVSCSSNTATINDDFQCSSNPFQLTFPDGSSSASGSSMSITITIQSDDIIEDAEDFQLSLTAVSSAAAVASGQGSSTVTITDQTVLAFGFQFPSYSIPESTGLSVSIVLLSGLLERSITVAIETSDDDAVAASDYSAGPVSVTFGVRSSIASAAIAIINDNVIEQLLESFGLSLSSSDNAVDVSGATSQATIVDDDSVTIGFTQEEYTVREDEGDVTVCVQRSDTDLDRDIPFNLSTTVHPGEAEAGIDFEALSPPLQLEFDTMMRNDESICVDITINDDAVVENRECFYVVISVSKDDSAIEVDPGMARVCTTNDDAVIIESEDDEYSVPEGPPDQSITIPIILIGMKEPGLECNVTVHTEDIAGGAIAGEDYIPAWIDLTFSAANPEQDITVQIIDDLIAESDESFYVVVTSSDDRCVAGRRAMVTIIDEEDCDDTPCDSNADCTELAGPDNFVCTCRAPFTIGDGFTCRQPVVDMGDDPHFSIALPSRKLLCYSVQGEHGFAFNLISNKMIHMNAMFVPDSRREEVTWLGSIGIIVRKSSYRRSNGTALRFEAKDKTIHIGDKIMLEARNIEKLTFTDGKLIISEAPPTEGFKYPAVYVDLKDVELSFTIKFMNEHLDLFWHSTGQVVEDSHGIIGQFFRKGVEIDEVRKILIIPNKEPVPVMRRPVWSFMEREMKDDQLCWTAMNPGYQGEGLIDGAYFDYLVNDVLSANFTFNKPQ